ncbi:MAG: ATP-binding protein, partial [Planctomycetota bacterium]
SEFIQNLDAHGTEWTKLIDSTFALESTMTMGDVYTQMRAQEDAFAAIIENGRPVGLCSRGALGFMMGSLYGHSVYSRKRITTHILEWYLIIPEGTTCEDAIAIALSRPRKIFYDDAIIVDQNGLFLGLISVNTLVAMQSALLAQKSKRLEEDLEKRYRAEESLRLANEQLEAAKVAAESANAAKSTFLSNMSHELRTPLNAVIGYSEMLEEMAMEDGKDDYILDLQKIRTAGKHLLELINAILDLSKIEAGKMELYIESFSITKLISDTTVLVEPLIIKNNNTLLVTCAPELQDISADATKLQQTLFNLLSNAAKFSQNGTITVDARSEVIDSREWVVIDMKDTGIGISPEQLSRLFQPFQQADASTTRKYGGTGLGLTISRQFCRMMGGELSVISRAGEGSTFTVRLPLAQTQVARPSKLLARRSSIRRLSVPSVPAITTKVLSIDDDESMRELLQRNLSKFGCDVYLSGSGESGLLTARQVRHDSLTH